MLFRSIFHKAGNVAKTTLAVVGLVSLGKLYSDYGSLLPSKPIKKRRILEIDFDKLDLVERKDGTYNYSPPGRERITMEVRELIEILHSVASDDSIAGVYGKFNQMSLNNVGWADLEEIRNAITVIQQSHRRHPEPNVTFDKIVIPKVSKKLLYSYGDSFGSLADPSNKSYYLASAFNDVHLQTNGELSLFGNLSSVFFIRELLETYKIQVHVFKQGVYKNAPNMFTHYKFNKFHQQQTQMIHDCLQEDINNDIVNSRSKALLTSWLAKNNWQSIHNSGIFPATTAWKAGLVDYLPRRDPLDDLVKHAESGDSDSSPAAWNVQETNFKKFTATSKVSLKEYAKQLKKHQVAAEKLQELKKIVQKYSFLEPLTSKLGLLDKTEASNTIALIHINGTIGDQAADSIVESLGIIKKKTKDDFPKAVVLRVNSRGGSIFACEKIQQELKALDVPVVVSFGNYSASGGYYIAMPAERIFASRKTLTGSIGVFGIRLDLTEFLAKYHINVQTIASSDLSATYSPTAPMTRKMKETFSQQIDRSYDRFKMVVSEGRNMDMAGVESLAKGQVYTGKIAKHNGLVDEIGGLHRAIAYAQRNYAENALIDVYPKEKSFWEKISEMKNAAQVSLFLWQCLGFSNSISLEASYSEALMQSLLKGHTPSSGIFYSADENGAIDCLLSTNTSKAPSIIQPPSWFWE